MWKELPSDWLEGLNIPKQVNITHWPPRDVEAFLKVYFQLWPSSFKNFCPSAFSLVWHTCASTLSGWVLYSQLELTKLTCPDLHHVVGLFILRDVCLSVCHTFFTVLLSLYCIIMKFSVSSWNFQELLPLTKVMSIQKVKVRGEGQCKFCLNLGISGL